MSLLDAAYHIGLESNYAEQATPTRSYEAQSLDPRTETQMLRRAGFRKGSQAARHAKTIVIGSEHPLVMDVQHSGMGLLLQALVASTTGPTQVAATSAYTQEHDWGAAGITDSLTCQQAIQFPETGSSIFTHVGCMATGFRFRQSADGLLQLEVDLVGADVVTDVAEAAAAYVSDPGCFDWSQMELTVDSAAFADGTSFEWSIDTAMKTTRYAMRNSRLRKKPVHTGYPTVGGTIQSEWTKTEFYDDFVNGAEIPLNAKWTGVPDAIEAGHTHEFEIDMGAIVFAGDAPTQQPDDVAMQSLPFEVVEPTSGPLFSIKTKSADTAL
ncbi:MAG: phage tail tube protein [Actinomycetota bacterium]